MLANQLTDWFDLWQGIYTPTIMTVQAKCKRLLAQIIKRVAYTISSHVIFDG